MTQYSENLQEQTTTDREAYLPEPHRGNAPQPSTGPARMNIGHATLPCPAFPNPQLQRKIQFMQRTYGNLATLQHFGYGQRVQARTQDERTVDEPLEKEAEAVSEDVMAGETSENGAAVSAVQFASASGRAVPSADDPEAVQSELGHGRPLEDSTRSRMESSFGRDFSKVGIHTDLTADRMNTYFNSRAFAVGSQVAFQRGEYQPGTRTGDKLIAHELAHTVQQGAAASSVSASPAAKKQFKRDSYYQALEMDAEQAAVKAVQSEKAVSNKGAQAHLISEARIQKADPEPGEDSAPGEDECPAYPTELSLPVELSTPVGMGDKPNINSNGVDIANMQLLLNEVGYFGLEVNGEYTDLVGEAILQFQTSEDLPYKDGRADPGFYTIDRLNQAAMEPALPSEEEIGDEIESDDPALLVPENPALQVPQDLKTQAISLLKWMKTALEDGSGALSIVNKIVAAETEVKTHVHTILSIPTDECGPTADLKAAVELGLSTLPEYDQWLIDQALLNQPVDEDNLEGQEENAEEANVTEAEESIENTAEGGLEGDWKKAGTPAEKLALLKQELSDDGYLVDKNLHYARNSKNKYPSFEVASTLWKECGKTSSAFHQQNGQVNNHKYMSPSGHYEVVFDLSDPDNPILVNDALNMGTYNYDASPTGEHWKFDVYPYIIWGNRADDSSTVQDRLAILGSSVAWILFKWRVKQEVIDVLTTE